MKGMARTQIYLTREQLRALDRKRKETGLSLAALIRRAIDRAYLARGDLSLEEELRIIRESSGAWRDRAETGAEYVERIRSGRLARLHGLEK